MASLAASRAAWVSMYFCGGISRQTLRVFAQFSTLNSSGHKNREIKVEKAKLPEGPSLQDFMSAGNAQSSPSIISSDDKEHVPYLNEADISGNSRKVYFETYGCQMNVNDTEVAWSILQDAGYKKVSDVSEADVILAVTCSIRENAERKVWTRLDYFRSLKRKRSRKLPPLKVGVLGCMAERLKKKILETDKMVDIVAGPDSYRDLPRLLSVVEEGQAGVNVLLSVDETYADVMPVRINSSSPSAFVSIMRGCENMCSFCIVPFTRGKERSRPVESILQEVKQLSEQGVREVTLLGQNVNSYRDLSQSTVPLTHSTSTDLSLGFKTIYKPKEGGRRFADLLDKVAQVDPEMRVRFTSPHPKDFPDELLSVIRDRCNVCNNVHMPAQSGNTAVLESMRRGYSREAYLSLVEKIRSAVPGVTLSSDFMAGFCGESESAHQDTLTLMESVRYDMAYLFAYSMRQKTHAYHCLKDDVPHEVKQRRLRELIDLHQRIAGEENTARIGQEHTVLVEKRSKRSDKDLSGRNDGNIKVIFPDLTIPCDSDTSGSEVQMKPGDYVVVKITGASSYSLKGTPLCRTNLHHHHLRYQHHHHHLSIMRGCENMCSFCIVPFTRGKERSRPVESILQEVKQLSEQGVREVTLLGQNVNSYRDLSQSTVPLTHSTSTDLSQGFKTIYKPKEGGRRFADLLDKVAQVDPEMRVRFTSPHPKDFPDELLSVIRDRCNVCNNVHMPAQSGNTAVLESMRRGYSREAYLSLVEKIRSAVPGVTLSSDFMTGFCGESESAHQDTLSLMESVRYDMAYLFAYSMRQKTHAYHRLKDDVPHEVKQRRLRELIDLHQRIAGEENTARIGQEHTVLVEKRSKRSDKDLSGRNDGNIKVIFPDLTIPCDSDTSSSEVQMKPGDYVVVKITGASSYSLKGIPICRTKLHHHHHHDHHLHHHHHHL